MEIWKDIEGHEGRYEVSTFGNVRNKKTMKIICPALNNKGYQILTLWQTGLGSRRTFSVHRLVAKAFIPNHESKPQVNHINGLKTYNHVSNLEWATASENQTHRRVMHGTSKSIKQNAAPGKIGAKKGAAHHKARLTDSDVIEIKKLLGEVSVSELAKMFKVSHTTISQIHTNKVWKHITTNP